VVFIALMVGIPALVLADGRGTQTQPSPAFTAQAKKKLNDWKAPAEKRDAADTQSDGKPRRLALLGLSGGTSACAGSACIGSGCVGSACLASGCGHSWCFGSACLYSGCGGSACIYSGCGLSGCVYSGCGLSGCIYSICLATKACIEGKACYAGEKSEDHGDVAPAGHDVALRD